MLVSCPFMRLRKSALRLSPVEIYSRQILIARNNLPSRGRVLLRDYVMKARPKPRRISPRITEPDQANVSIEEYLPSVNLLKAAYKAGVLDIKPETTLNIIRRYVHGWHSERVGWEKRVLEEENIKPETLTTISLILNRSTEYLRKILATRLLRTASSLGDPIATVHILTSALRSQSLHKSIYATELSRLKAMANSSNPNLSALMLLGRIQESQSNPSAALHSFRKAASLSSKSPDPAQEPIIAEALVAQGMLLLARKDTAGAHEAFCKAALDHDNPHGYLHLATSSALSRSTRVNYLLKSASSGIPDAAAQLGSLYLEIAMSIGEDMAVEGKSREESHRAVRQGMEGVNQSSKGEEKEVVWPIFGTVFRRQMAREMGKEWLVLGAEAGSVGCMRGLADVFHREGQNDVAERWERLAAEREKAI